MSENPLIVSDDLDDVLERAIKQAAASSRPGDPLPSDSAKRLAVVDAIDADCRAWESVLLSLLTAISVEKRAVASVILSVSMPYPEIDLEPLGRMQQAIYCRHFEADEVRQVVNAIAALWELRNKSSEWRCQFPVWMAQTKRIVFDGHALPSDANTKDSRRMVREIRTQWKSLFKNLETRDKAWIVMGHSLARQFSLDELRKVLAVLREFFKATDCLRLRAGLPQSMSAEQPSQDDLNSVLELGKMDAELQSALGVLGMPARMADCISTAQRRYLIWAAWNRHLTPAQIRDKWNAEFPSYLIDGNKKSGSAHVRIGIGRGNLFVLARKRK